MCAQCTTTGAIVATTAATGARVWLAAKAPWFDGRLKAVTSAFVLGGGVVVAAAVA